MSVCIGCDFSTANQRTHAHGLPSLRIKKETKEKRVLGRDRTVGHTLNRRVLYLLSYEDLVECWADAWC